MFKPQDDGIKPWPRRIQANDSRKDNLSSLLNSDTLHHVNNLSCNDSKDCQPSSGQF